MVGKSINLFIIKNLYDFSIFEPLFFFIFSVSWIMINVKPASKLLKNPYAAFVAIGDKFCIPLNSEISKKVRFILSTCVILQVSSSYQYWIMMVARFG